MVETASRDRKLTGSFREKCQDQLAELRKAGLWIGIEYLIDQYHETRVGKRPTLDDKVLFIRFRSFPAVLCLRHVSTVVSCATSLVIKIH